MIDTHCHLNFRAFKKNLDEVVAESKKTGVTHIVVPGTDIDSSKKAIEIAKKYKGVYAAVGIHPHHVFELASRNAKRVTQEINQLEKILSSCDSRYTLHDTCSIVAIGEIGLDKYIYKKTNYKNYHINDSFFNLQKELYCKTCCPHSLIRHLFIDQS